MAVHTHTDEHNVAWKCTQKSKQWQLPTDWKVKTGWHLCSRAHTRTYLHVGSQTCIHSQPRRYAKSFQDIKVQISHPYRFTCLVICQNNVSWLFWCSVRIQWDQTLRIIGAMSAVHVDWCVLHFYKKSSSQSDYYSHKYSHIWNIWNLQILRCSVINTDKCNETSWSYWYNLCGCIWQWPSLWCTQL